MHNGEIDAASNFVGLIEAFYALQGIDVVKLAWGKLKIYPFIFDSFDTRRFIVQLKAMGVWALRLPIYSGLMFFAFKGQDNPW